MLWLLYYIYKYKYNLMFSCFNSTREGTNKRHTLHIWSIVETRLCIMFHLFCYSTICIYGFWKKRKKVNVEWFQLHLCMYNVNTIKSILNCITIEEQKRFVCFYNKRRQNRYKCLYTLLFHLQFVESLVWNLYWCTMYVCMFPMIWFHKWNLKGKF